MDSVHQLSKHSFQYGNSVVNYDLIKSKRRKICEIIIDRNKITVRSPYEKPLSEIEAIMQEKIKWISRNQKEFRDVREEMIKPNFHNNSTLPYVGKNYPLIVILYNQVESFELDNNKFIARLTHENSNNTETIEKLYNKWLLSKAKTIVEEKVKVYGRIMNKSPKRIVLKNLKKRWGSISKDKTLNLNINLLKAPEDVINYLIMSCVTLKYKDIPSDFGII
jgi:hypothetical protein